MSKGSGGTRLINPGAGVEPALSFMSNEVRNDYMTRKKGKEFENFLVEAAKYGFIIDSTSDNGSIVEIYRNINTSTNDYRDLVKIAHLRAEETQSIVQLTPSVHFKSDAYQQIYRKLLGTVYERKCPDIRITTIKGKQYFEEYESFVRPSSDRKVSNMLKDGLVQSSRVIVDVRDGIDVTKVIKGIRGRIGQYTIDRVTLYNGNSLKTVYRKDNGFLPPYELWNKKGWLK